MKPKTNKSFLIIFSFVLSIQVLWYELAGATALSTMANSLSPGQWGQVSDATMNGWNTGQGPGSVLVPYSLSCTSSDYITQFASKAGYDPLTKRFLFVGATHGNCYGGRFVIYDDISSTWSQGPWLPGLCQSGSPSVPCFDHAYEHNTTDPSTGDHYYRYMGSAFYKYTASTSTWVQKSYPATGASSQCCGGLAFFPDTGRVIYYDGSWGVWSYNPGNDSWIQLSNGSAVWSNGSLPSTPSITYNNWAEYDFACNCVLFGGGTTMYKINSNNAITLLAPPPISIQLTSTVQTVDPVSGDLIVLANDGMHAYTPSTSSWRMLSVTIPSFLTGGLGVGDGLIAAPISSYNVIMYVKYSGVSGQVWLYKHGASTPSPADTVAPSVPTGLLATSVSSNQINLSWSASTDNVGVSGYNVYRNGTQIARITGTSYQDTGLLASSTYSYTVAAYDFTGNLSSQSASASATTLNMTSLAPPSTSAITLVDFGPSSASNVFGLAGWSTVIKDVYTDYQNIGPGGTTIVVGSNYTYNYQGVTGTARTFNAGDAIVVTWYNNSSAAVSFTPNITFTSPNRIIAGTGTWYPMRLVTVPPFGSATSNFVFSSATAGSYSLVNVNVNYTNTQVVVADKIQLIPAGSSSSSFDLSLSNGGNQSVTQGQSASNSIAATLASGAAQTVTFSASGLPPGALASFSSISCSPSCSSTLTISTTGATPAGSSTITVSATGGGVTRSTSFTFTVNASTGTSTPPPTGSADFQARCTAAGVIRCFGFDTVADLGGTYGDNYGNFNNGGPCNSNGTTLCPSIDTTTSASGGGSMKFVMPTGGGAGAAGQWFTNFSSDLATQFGAGGEFWVQWRQRFDSNYVTYEWQYTDVGGAAGPKQAIISSGDMPGCTRGTSASGNCRGSCQDIEIVPQDLWQRGYPQLYNSCVTFNQLGADLYNGSDFKYQNNRPSPYCLRSQWIGGHANSFPPIGNCFGYFANEWMTFKVHVKVGTLSASVWTGSQVDLWIGREGQPLEKVIAATNDLYASTNKYGKVWLLPYVGGSKTGADTTTPPITTWYDELIISTQDIADPSGTMTSGTGTAQPPAAPSSLSVQ